MSSRTSLIGLFFAAVALGVPLRSAADEPAGTDANGPTAAATEAPTPAATIAEYYTALDRAGLIDPATGTAAKLDRELGRAQELLLDGNPVDAAVVLYPLVESPRYDALKDTVQYQSAEYYLGAALANAGAYDSALRYLERTMKRGPTSMYFAPAHRKAVDIAIETREFARVLHMLESVPFAETLPAGAAGERDYLRARIAYEQAIAGDEKAYDRAEMDLDQIGPKSRLYSSALYLRGVIAVRRGRFTNAAESLCKIVDTPDDATYTFVVDERYFTIKDLARLGLGRIAHEQGEYDDAYYHYFQIPDDSERLPEALFEAAWSMYQKRELATARDLVKEFLDNFPSSPLVPEARLLAGYIELADCKFERAQKLYTALARDMQPIVDEIASMRKRADLRRVLFARALQRRRAQRVEAAHPEEETPDSVVDSVLGLLRLDPEFVRIHAAIAGLKRAAGDAPNTVRLWHRLAARVANTKVEGIATNASIEDAEANDADALLDAVRRLQEELELAREELRRGSFDGRVPETLAQEESQRLDQLAAEIATLRESVAALVQREDAGAPAGAESELARLIHADLEQSRQLRHASTELLDELTAAADALAEKSLERLYADARRVLDKARLGKIDAVIGQKRKLDIEVRDLAVGRYPPELQGRMWEQGLIGDDEEYWPFEGEYWADEYEGWR